MGDTGWLKDIFIEYKNLIYRIAVSITKDPSLAEDVVQDVFVTLYYKKSSIRDKSKIKPWLTKTTVNRAIDFTRKRQKTTLLPDDFLTNWVEGPEFDPVATFEQKEFTLEMERAINSLPENLKLLITLYYYIEMPQNEIASSLKLPLGTVKTRLKRARALLKCFFTNIENGKGKKLSNSKEVKPRG